MIDGLIRLQAHASPRERVSEPVPVVAVGLDPEGDYDLVVDEGRGIEIAVEHLHRLGHRRIGLVGEPLSQPRGELHARAYRRAMLRLGAGGAELDRLIAHYHERHPASAPQAVETLLSRGQGLTAIVFTDDKAAMGGYGALRTARLRVPDQVSVVGWRDNDAGLFLVPPLTTIALPMRTTAFAATDLLLRRIDGDAEAAAPQRVFDPYLVQRASTAPPSE
jgi:LacI family transcriptional regulator